MALKLRKSNVGDCECCTRTDVELTPMHNGTMLMCEFCIKDEASVVKAAEVIQESNKKDSAIITKADIYNAATTSFVELGGAIHANPEIAEEQKKYAYATEASKRIEILDAAIFSTKEHLTKLQNERAAWLKNTHDLVSTLRADQRAKFAQFDMNYKPATPTITRVKKVATSKTPTPSTTAFRYSHKELKEACAKHGADMTTIRMMLTGNKSLTLEAAIQKYLAIERS